MSDPPLFVGSVLVKLKQPERHLSQWVRQSHGHADTPWSGMSLAQGIPPPQSAVTRKSLLVSWPSPAFLSSSHAFSVLFFLYHCFCLWQFNYGIDSHFNLFKAAQLPFQLIQLYLLCKLQPHLKMINY